MSTATKLELSNGSSPRGAQMGRRDVLPADPSQPIKLRLERLRFVDGDYDQWGAYWGYVEGTMMFCAHGGEGEQKTFAFVRARNRAEAKGLVIEKIPGAKFHDGPPLGTPTPCLPSRSLTLHAPFEISARLLPAVRVGPASWVSIEYAPLPGRDGRTRYRYFIDMPDGTNHSASDIQSGCQGGSLQEGMVSLLSFLSSAADCFRRVMRSAGGSDEDAGFPARVAEWAYHFSEEIAALQIQISETKGLVEEL